MAGIVTITVEDVIEEVTLSIDETTEDVSIKVIDDTTTISLVIQEIYGLDGKTPVKGVDYNDGYTPVKGVDYNDGYTPRKGIDYNDGNDGRTPVKGVDYFDGYTPIKGIDYRDGLDSTVPGPAFEYSDFTTEQLNALKVKGDPGKDFKFSDFTSEQLAALTGEDYEVTQQDLINIAALVPIPSTLASFTDDSTHRLTTDTEKSTWNSKQPAGSYLVASDVTNKTDINLAIALAVAL